MRILTVITALVIAHSVGRGQNISINKSGSSADASAILDLNSGNDGTKGFLPQQVALTATNAAGPVAGPATGLMVYNTATAGTTPNNVIPGYYYWNSSSWVLLNTASKSFMRLPSLIVSSAPNFKYYTSALTPGSGYNFPTINYPLSNLTSITANGSGSFYWGTLNNINNMVSSDGFFSRVFGWINSGTTGTVTIYAYVYTFTNGATTALSGVQIGSVTVTIGTANRNYQYEIPRPITPFSLSKGQLIMIWYDHSVTMTNMNASGTVETLLFPQ